METIAAPLPGAGAAAPAPRKRWYRADNIRWLMLFNVVAEHLLTQTNLVSYNAEYNWIIVVIVCWSRMITMPTFCFISGYFSKKGDKCYNSAIFDFLIPYIIFDTIFSLIFGFGSDCTYNNIFTATFAYWYLLCMFSWKLLTKALQQIKYIIPLSFVISLLVGTCPDVGPFLCVSRTLVFLPYYVVGMKMSREQVAKLENLPKVPVIVITLIVMAFWGWLNVHSIEVFSNVFGVANHNPVEFIDFYYNDKGYAHYDFNLFTGLLFRALGYVVSGLLIVCLYCTVPDRSMRIIREGGTRTMVPYLLHTFFIMYVRYLYTYVPVLDSWYVAVPVALLLGVGIMKLLGLPALNDLYNSFVGAIKKLLYNDPAAPSSGKA